ncbi:TIGR03086 family metal-binding protein [Cryptosporangium arvum]|uniref:TIGR03086 family metal-binding protein n=1 Tax=Cryptosporangium arvum TaxID=80871 RepID=UPI0004AF8F91|nr:TIGR03086 family metal-binding protein [Cryptosporangium arvum]
MHTDLTDLRDLDARAVALSARIVDTITPDDLGRPTPCTGWTVADLMRHLIAQHHGFAAATRGGSDWELPTLDDDLATQYRKASDEVVAAFASVDDPDQPLVIPDFGARPTPAHFAITAHAVDYLVHAWDVAAALGQPFAPENDLVDALLPIVLSLPDDERRTEPGSPFAPSLPQTPGAPAVDQLLRALGRDPYWLPS